MAICAEQRELRKRYIGSSDAAAVCGLDPYRSAFDVWLEKTGQADGFEGNENTERGNLLEPVVLAWAQDKIGQPFKRDVMMVAPDGLLVANLDGVGYPKLSGDFIVEAKTSTSIDEWGEPGTDQVPERVTVQVHHQFAVAGPAYRLAYVPVLLPVFGRFDFRLYRVERSDELADVVAERGAAFMRDHVLRRVAPEGCLPSLEVLKRVRREPKSVVPVADELVDSFVALRAARLQAEKDEREAEKALLAALGTAEGGEFSRGMCTYFETKRKGYTVAETVYRSLKIKVNKGA
jgi:putative phage-type endonuclease